jgi:nitrate/nitrite transporter NarK
MYGTTLWLPSVIHVISGLGYFWTSMVNVLPFLATVVVMVLVGMRSDRTGERRWHTAFPLILSATAFLFTILSGSHFWVAFACLTVASLANAFLPAFWPMPSAFLGESAAAASIGLINSIGNLGSFATPAVIGYFLDRTQSFTLGFVYVIASLMIAILLTLSIQAPKWANKVSG